MQSMQRQFGRMLHKDPGDNAKVAVLLSDVSNAIVFFWLLLECGRLQSEPESCLKSWVARMDALTPPIDPSQYCND